jgi:folate-binding protein YgfZ
MDADEGRVVALEAGRAFVDLSAWRTVLVGGTDAAAWLNDLLTADLAGMGTDEGRRSLLLSPTGRIRAEVTVVAVDDGFVLVQDPIQDAPIDRALAPYVLSSDVTVEDANARFRLLAFPGAEPPPGAPGQVLAPSVLGEGADLLLSPSEGDEAMRGAREAGLAEVDLEAVEAWRIRRGLPRVGVDLGEDSLPHEAPVDRLIGYGKGCFLGQEAVAKVRNLGHPPFVLVAVTAPDRLSAGDPVRVDGTDVGLVTSATGLPDHGSAAIARVRWTARDAELEALSGAPLEVRRPSTPT